MSKQLDKQLKTWADGTEAPPEHLEALANRVRDEIVRERVHTATRSHHSHWHRLLYVTAGAAAAFLITFLWFGAQRGNIGSGNGMAAANTGAIPTDRLETAARLVGEMNRLFDENWRWVAESNGDMNMGVARLHGGVDKETQSMVVRVTLAAKEEGGQPWQEVWHSDIVIRSEEAVEITPNKDYDNCLAFWVLPMANGTLHIDTAVSLSHPLRVASRESMVVKDGAPSELASFSRGKTSYKLYQTVKLLSSGKKDNV
jgi:hypothetical protein